MKNIFTPTHAEEIIQRINSLNSSSQAKWGKMDVSQMLAHCNVTYELVYDNKHPKPNFILTQLLKWFVKESVVSTKSYKHNGNTAPVFIIKSSKDFATEKIRLIEHINKTLSLGENYFHNKESHSFGVLTKDEWNNLFYKHLDHHLTQFGV